MEGGVKEKRREGEGGKRRRDWGLEGLCPIGSNGEGGRGMAGAREKEGVRESETRNSRKRQ